MGGRGSGRPAAYGLLVDKCEDFRSVDIAWLRREGMLKTGYTGTVKWSRNGNVTGWIQYRVEQDGLRLIYRAREPGGEWQGIDELFPFTTTATNFGGQRQWLLCPCCKRRCRIIYGGTYFRCRTCHALKYESQYEMAPMRTTSQRHKLREQLGQSGSLDEPFPPKPRGMHWKTYERLRAKDEQLERAWCQGVAAWLKRIGPRR